MTTQTPALPDLTDTAELAATLTTHDDTCPAATSDGACGCAYDARLAGAKVALDAVRASRSALADQVGDLIGEEIYGKSAWSTREYRELRTPHDLPARTRRAGQVVADAALDPVTTSLGQILYRTGTVGLTVPRPADMDAVVALLRTYGVRVAATS